MIRSILTRQTLNVELRLFNLLAVAALSAACIPAQAPTPIPSLHVQSDLLTPTVVMNWEKRVVSATTFGPTPTELAAPAHSEGTDELVVATSSQSLLKFQASSGEELWSIRLPAAAGAAPTVARNTVFVGTMNGDVLAYDLFSGEKRWSVTVGNTIESSPVIAEGRVFIKDTTDILYVLDAADGSELWRHQRPTPEYFMIKNAGSVLVSEGEVFAGYADGHLVALQLETGDLLWGVDLSAGKDRLVDVNQTPIVRQDRIIAASYSGGLYSIDRISGEIVWRAPLSNITHVREHQGFIYASLASGRVVALDADSGQETWGFKFSSALPSHLLVFGGYLIVTTSESTYILDRNSGYAHSRVEFGRFSSPLTIGADRVYGLNDLGLLRTFQLGW